MILLLRCCLSKVGWFRKARRLTPTLLILRQAVLSAFYPVFKEPGRAFPARFRPLTATLTVVRGTLQSYDGRSASVNPCAHFSCGISSAGVTSPARRVPVSHDGF